MTDSDLRLVGISKEYSGKAVVDSVNITISQGDFLTILGPSGAGKTTVLKMIAGFENLTGGKIMLNGENISGIPTSKRNIGMLFQNYALFPHMTVFENIAYPLKIRRFSKSEINQKVSDILEKVKLKEYGDRYPKQLSGGQQQRVALARAIVFNPPILLLDEPMAALDKQLRKHMQLEVKQLHDELGLTTISVTHDQEEALTMATKVCVMKNGKVEQIASPDEIYNKPANSFIASFIGEANILEGRIIAKEKQNHVSIQMLNYVTEWEDVKCWFSVGDEVKLVIRPEKIKLLKEGELFEGYVFKGELRQIVYVGEAYRLMVETKEGTAFKIKTFSAYETSFRVGEELRFGIKKEDIVVVNR